MGTAGSSERSAGVDRAISVAATPTIGGIGSLCATASQEPTRRASETVIYRSNMFVCGDPRGRSFARILAIRVFRTGTRPSPDGVLLEVPAKGNATSATEATRIEILFERNAH